ncbi:MAG: DUF2784 domain-containing protein [Gammaproteobacteria bacterium]|nr:DUF2784 domain-containing protein [Gammaproteobacteria bacterium]
MVSSLLADLVLVIHFALILFALFGALAVMRWGALIWLHLPYVAWSAAVNLIPMTCPLTPLENTLRHRAGEAGYEGGFIDHYLTALIYPNAMDETTALVAGVSVIVWNVGLYAWIVRSRRHRATARP